MNRLNFLTVHIMKVNEQATSKENTAGHDTS